jgi:uncharacterized protein (TIGR03435 family)
MNLENMAMRVRPAAIAAIALLVALALVAAPRLVAQSQSASAQSAAPGMDYQYEVATIKPSAPMSGGAVRIGIMNTPDGFTASGVPLRLVIQQAFGLQNDQLIDVPDWANTSSYEIDAKMDPATADALQKMNQDDRTAARQKMMQALLADRFKLVIHHETRELPVYTLTVGKGGSKMKVAPPDEQYPAPLGGRGGPGGPGGMFFSMGPTGASITGQGVPIANLVRLLSLQLHRVVLDKTGLTANYDFTLQFAMDMPMGMMAGPQGPPGAGPGGPPPNADPAAPPLIPAVQEQLGLKLESGKGPVDVVVVTHVERPSEN